jgi:hypothetical protein
MVKACGDGRHGQAHKVGSCDTDNGGLSLITTMLQHIMLQCRFWGGPLVDMNTVHAPLVICKLQTFWVCVLTLVLCLSMVYTLACMQGTCTILLCVCAPAGWWVCAAWLGQDALHS